jgi:23S rRNA pseudouridine2605 synthase
MPDRPGGPDRRGGPDRQGGRVSLARALSKLGVCSRSEATRLIEDGRVTVDGRQVSNPSTRIVPERARLAIDGHRSLRAAPTTIALHKPRGVVSTRRDPEGRPTVCDLVRDAGGHLAAVGRLDRASTGC